MPKDKKENIPLPEIGPYVFPSLLAIFGLWCSYDGWLSSSIDMQEHQLFNKITGGILLPWSVIYFIRTWRIEKSYNTEITTNKCISKDDSES